MKTEIARKNCTLKVLITGALIFLISLLLIGCGDVASVGGIDTGGGGINSLMLSWTAPTTNEDGSPLDDLAGYKLHYGTQPGQYTQVVTVGSYTTAEIGDLGTGTYYLTVTAYDIYGNESEFSNEINHTFF
jgi:hypothetical protein